MPSKSPAQHRLMEAAAHTPGGFGGVPQKVGKEFSAADAQRAPRRVKRMEHMQMRKAAGVSVRGIGREFGTSKSTAHRALSKGYVPMGRA